MTVQVRDGKDQDDRVNAVTDDTINLTVSINNVEEPGRIDLSSRQPQVGTRLVAVLSDPDGNITGVTWKWRRANRKDGRWECHRPVQRQTLTPRSPKKTMGKYLRARAFYTDGHGSGKRAEAVSDLQVRADACQPTRRLLSTRKRRPAALPKTPRPRQDIGLPR